MNGFRQGRERSITIIFNQLYTTLCFYAVRITNNQAAAEDIVEESFIKIWDRRENFFHFQVIKSFLYTTVRNASINWVKQNKSQENALNGGYSAFKETANSKLEDLISVETFRELYIALDNLPPQCRKIITMLFIEGKKPGQVAEELQLSVANVSTQKKRGIMLLRKILPNLIFYCYFLSAI